MDTFTCHGCNNIFPYNGFIPPTLCSGCANNKRAEERHREQIAADERNREYDTERAERLEREREEYDARQAEYAEELAEEIHEAAYKQHNPGDYKCPTCLYVTLRANAARCPSCRADVPASYWQQIRKNEEEAAQRKAQQEAHRRSEEKRLAPLREAQALVASLKKQVAQKNEHWDSLFWAIMLALFLLGLSLMSLSFLNGIDVFNYKQSNGLTWLVLILLTLVCGIAGFISLFAGLPIIAVRVVWLSVAIPIKISTINRQINTSTKRLNTLIKNTVVREGNISIPETSIFSKVLGGFLIIFILGLLVFIEKALWLDRMDSTRSVGIENIVQSEDHINYEQSSALTGERYPFTRLTILNNHSVIAMNQADTQYAINEMFARHGAWFPNDEIRSNFQKFSWYKPNKENSFDQIERKFSSIESNNLKILAAHRDRLKRESNNQRTLTPQRLPEARSPSGSKGHNNTSDRFDGADRY